MNTVIKTTLSLLTIMTPYRVTHAQGMKIGEVIIVSTSTLKEDVKAETFQAHITEEIVPSWNKGKPGVSMHLFRADRGNRKGEFLLVCGATKLSDRNTLSPGSPFTSTRLPDFLSNPDSYTEYHLIGAEKFKSLHTVGILGIHYIKVKQDRSNEFEKFVIEKLHPAVGQLLPDMQLLYYKAVVGENAGTYITIFAIESVAARDKYWPSGAPETELLKQAFRPLNGLAAELGSYLVEGSYLEPKGGAAAYFESREWTDFIHQGF
jgi:hypothetical protein